MPEGTYYAFQICENTDFFVLQFQFSAPIAYLLKGYISVFTINGGRNSKYPDFALRIFDIRISCLGSWPMPSHELR